MLLRYEGYLCKDGCDPPIDTCFSKRGGWSDFKTTRKQEIIKALGREKFLLVVLILTA
jgi:hypothetical protein